MMAIALVVTEQSNYFYDEGEFKIRVSVTSPPESE